MAGPANDSLLHLQFRACLYISKNQGYFDLNQAESENLKKGCDCETFSAINVLFWELLSDHDRT